MKNRQMLYIIAAAIIIVAAVALYMVTRPTTPVVTGEPPATPATATPPASPAQPAESSDDVMAPGPLGDKSLGKADAPVTVIEYASMTCSHCAHFHQTTYPTFKKNYIDTGKVRFIFREFPLDQLAVAASMLARCAPGDAYFPIVDLLFDHQDEWAFVEKNVEALFNMVKQAGFTQESFNACLSNTKIQTGVTAVRDRAGEKFGVNSTPTFFINGKKYAGALELDELQKILDPLVK